MSVRPLLLLVAAVVIFPGCGGGSGSARNVAPPAPPPPPNQAPTARASSSASAAREGDLVTLSALDSSDPDGRISAYAWTQSAGPVVALRSPSGSTTDFTAPDVSSDTTLAFSLRVTDDDGAAAVDSVSLVIQPTFTLSGTIAAAGGTAVDGDVNDLAAPRTPNNLPGEAQNLPNPVTLGGYVNLAGTGEPGALQQSGDRSDFYRVELITGQHIALAVADADVGDPDLYLWDAAGGNVIAVSADTDDQEDLNVPADGVYLVEVYAFSGATNYTLVIGQPTGTAALSQLTLNADFVPGELILQRRAEPANGIRTAVDRMAALGVSPTSAATSRPVLAHVAPVQGAAVRRKLRAASPGGIDHLAAMPDAAARLKYQTLLAIKALRADPSIEYAQPNYRVSTQAIPGDPYYPLQWHYPMIHLPAAWDITIGDGGVRVAVIDTGVLLNHPDLVTQTVAGFDFVSRTGTSGDGDGIDDNADDPGDSDGVGPSSFHGSHVAGTIAAATNNGQGVAGIAPGARIVPVRVLGIGGGTTDDIIEGIRYAAGLANASGTLIPPVDVMNLSLGSVTPRPCSPGEQAAFDAARAAGVIVVVAAGNSSADASLFAPANCRGVLTVGAVDLHGNRAWYSNFGPDVDLAAPGGDNGVDDNGDGYVDGVLSSVADDQSGEIIYAYGFYNGTSMAAPHVAGVMALMRSVNPTLTPDQIDQLLANGALTDENGIVDAYKAVSAARDSVGMPLPENPVLTVSPSSLNFGTTFNHAEIDLRISGSGTLTVGPPQTVGSALTVTALNVDANGLGRYAVSLDRSGLADGTYGDTITFTSSVNSVEIPVIIQVSSSEVFSDVGHTYVLLLDAETGDVLDQRDMDADRGLYNYAFEGLDPGSYQLIGGTDADNDLFICDVGEACGRYPTLEQPLTVEVEEGDVSGVDFTVGPIVSLPSSQTGVSQRSSRAEPRVVAEGESGFRREVATE